MPDDNKNPVTYAEMIDAVLRLTYARQALMANGRSVDRDRDEEIAKWELAKTMDRAVEFGLVEHL